MALRIEKLDRLFQLSRGINGAVIDPKKNGDAPVVLAPNDFTVAGKAFAYKPGTVKIVRNDEKEPSFTQNDFTVIQKNEDSEIRAAVLKSGSENRLRSFVVEERIGVEKTGSRGFLNRRLIANVDHGDNRIYIEYLTPAHQVEDLEQELKPSATILASIDLATGEIGNFQRTGQVRRAKIPLSDAEKPKYLSEIETLLRLLNENLPT